MTYTAPVAAYSATLEGTYTALTGIQSISVTRGRQRFQDNFPQSNCVIELIPANSYALPLAVGQFIDVRDANNGTSPCYFTGRITDISRRFDMPFDAGSGAAPGDRITITATGPTGQVGASSFAGETFVTQTVDSCAREVANRAGVWALRAFISTSINTQAITFTGGALDLLNGVLRTGQLFVDDLDSRRTSYVANRDSLYIYNFNTTPAFTFSDAGTVGAFKFAALEYLSSVQNVFTQVEVTAPGIATQTSTAGVEPFNTLVYNTFTNSAADSKDIADYVLATQSLVNITPFTVSTSTLLSPTCTLLSRTARQQSATIVLQQGNIGATVNVIFRGTTVAAVIQGINTTFYPDQARVQLYLSPSLGSPFQLDSASLGVLDQNRLGL
jgi:hypothetical protein